MKYAILNELTQQLMVQAGSDDIEIFDTIEAAQEEMDYMETAFPATIGRCRIVEWPQKNG